jgi:hypothetical protein
VYGRRGTDHPTCADRRMKVVPFATVPEVHFPD